MTDYRPRRRSILMRHRPAPRVVRVCLTVVQLQLAGTVYCTRCATWIAVDGRCDCEVSR